MKIDEKAGMRSNDNFFESYEAKFRKKGVITVVDVKNDVFSSTVNLQISSGVLRTHKEFLEHEK